jgi:hypothetical protein
LKAGGHPPIGPAAIAGAAIPVTITAVNDNTKSIRLIKHYLLVRATLGGLLLI